MEATDRDELPVFLDAEWRWSVCFINSVVSKEQINGILETRKHTYPLSNKGLTTNKAKIMRKAILVYRKKTSNYTVDF